MDVSPSNNYRIVRGSEMADQEVGTGSWTHRQVLIPQPHTASLWEGGNGVKIELAYKSFH